MKRLLAVMLSLLLVLSFVGCDKDEDPKTPADSGETVTASTDNTTVPGEETVPDTSETTETETDTVNPPEAKPETQPESDTQPEEITEPEEPSADVSDTLNTVLERLVTSGGISLTADGKLSVVTTLFGMQVITDMPLSLSLITAANGLSAQAQIPMAGAYGLTMVDGVLYLSDEEGKYSCELPKAEDEDEDEDDATVPALPAWGEEEQAMILESVAELIDQLTSVVHMEIDPLTGSVTATVSLCEGAARLADELRAAMEEWETEAETEAGESIPSEDDLANMELVLAWLDTVAASPDAKLVFTAALDGEDAMVSVSIACPMDVSLLLSLLPEDEAGSALPADMSSTGDLSLTVTLRCGQMSVTAPEDAEDYTLTDWETIEAAIESVLDSLLSDTDVPSEEYPVIGA